MMKKSWMYAVFVFLFLVISACSQSNSTKEAEITKDEAFMTEEGYDANSEVVESKASVIREEAPPLSTSSVRKVMYSAHLHTEVDDTKSVIHQLKDEAEKRNGYLIESSVSEMEEFTESYVSFRIPQEKFEEFLSTIKKHVKNVKNEQVTGTDVTDEYVDLQSRLKAKKAVEERLLQFLNQAEKMEDVIRISTELANVQEEIERIKGRIQYLDNKTDFATVHVYLSEAKAPAVSTDEFNMGERIKHQWIASLNGLFKALSGMIIFIIGNAPIWITIFVSGFLGFKMYQKLVLKKGKNSDKRHDE